MNEYELRENFSIENIKAITKEGKERRVRIGIPCLKEEICFAAKRGDNSITVRDEYLLKEVLDYFTEKGFTVYGNVISW